MASYSVKGSGVDSREVALAAKGRVAVDKPTPEIAFVKMERRTDGVTRTIMILHQVWVRPDGVKYWREVVLKTESEILRQNQQWEREAAAAV